MTARIAILVFTREAGKEARCKGLSSRLNPDCAREITSSLIANTISSAAESGLPYFIISSPAQKGANFGERFQNAFQTVFSGGYSAVIAIGTDCPGLRSSDILQAANELRKGRSALGPASDGGTWLTGLTRSQFGLLNFDDLPWNSGNLCSSLQESLVKLGERVVLLSQKGDVDTIEDLYNAAGEYLWLDCLLAFFNSTSFPDNRISCLSGFVFGPDRRGPPQLPA